MCVCVCLCVYRVSLVDPFSVTQLSKHAHTHTHRYEYRLAAENIAGLGPYSGIQFADVIAPGVVTEPEPGPFHTQIWFIVVMVVAVLILIAMVATVILLVKFFVERNKARTTYSCE